MAIFSFDTTVEEDAAIAQAVKVYNTQSGEQETPEQFITRHLRHKINNWVQEHRAAAKETREELYNRASAIDRATIDAILDKTREGL